jgi:hypothetical protein
VSGIPALWVAAGLALAAGLGIAGLIAWRRRRGSTNVLLRRIAWDRLADVVIPDDVEGEIHLDLALLTARGLLVLEVRHAHGKLYWGEQLEHWTILHDARRTVLRNPLPGMHARHHAVRALAPGVPVEARVLLVGQVEASGGLPPGVLRTEELAAEFPARGRSKPSEELRRAWSSLKAAARPA